jgi:hypothetical protein
MNVPPGQRGGPSGTIIGCLLALLLMTTGLGSALAETAGHGVPLTSVAALVLVLGVLALAPRLSTP